MKRELQLGWIAALLSSGLISTAGPSQAAGMHAPLGAGPLAGGVAELAPGIGTLPRAASSVVFTAEQDAAAQDAAAGFLVDQVPAQFDMSGLDPRADRTKLSAIRSARGDYENRVTSALSAGGSMSSADQDLVRSWVTQVMLAETTSLDPSVQVELGNMRQELFRKYIRATTNDANRSFLLNTVLIPKTADLASKNYHPAARVNAALILGMLDSQEAVSGQQPPRPSIRALGELLRLVDAADSPDFLVAACLSGIQRHAELDGQFPANEKMAEAARSALIDSMLRLIKKYQGQWSEKDAGYVLSRRAMQTLGGLKLPPNHPKAAEVKAMADSLANNAAAGKWLRLDAMLALASMPMDDPVAYLESLGKLVVFVSKAERTSVLEAKKLAQIDGLIKDKTGMAMAKKKTDTNDGLPVDGPSAGGAGNAASSVGDMGGGGGGGMGGMMDLSGFDESGLFPYHLHYARTNIKVAAAVALQVLGTNQRTPGGLKVSLRDNQEAQRLIDFLDKEFKSLIEITDIGLVEEKPKTEAELRRMDPQERFLLEQSPSVRVLAGVGKSIVALEKLVGTVEMPVSDSGVTADEEEVSLENATNGDSAAIDENTADENTADENTGDESTTGEAESGDTGAAPPTGGDAGNAPPANGG